jgi:hypothetical protein
MPVNAASTAWLSPEWKFRMPIAVQHSGAPLTDYQVNIQLDGSFVFGNAQSDGRDLRVTAADGVTPLPFWIEKWGSGAASVYVKVPVIAASGTTIYLYYGNADASSLSNGAATFEFFDDFEPADGQKPALNKAKWTASGGLWQLITDLQQDKTKGIVLRAATPDRQILYSTTFQGTDYVLEASGKQLLGREWGLGIRVQGREELYGAHLYDDMPDRDNLYIHRLNRDSATVLGSFPVGVVDLNTWYKLTMKVHGNLIDVYKDGELKIHTADAAFVSGRIALWTGDRTITEFNNVLVRKFTDSEPTVTAGIEEPADISTNPDSGRTARMMNGLGLAGPMGEGPTGNLIDATVADFSAGTVDSNGYIAQTTDGEVTLKPIVGQEFSGTSIPSGWTVGSYFGTPSSTVSSGSILLNTYALLSTTTTFSAGRTLEFYGTLGAVANHHFGFGTALNNEPWAIFSTGTTSNTVMARSNGSTSINYTIPGITPDVPHKYRIVWNSSSIVYYVDDVQVASHGVTISTQMALVAGNASGSGSTGCASDPTLRQAVSPRAFSTAVYQPAPAHCLGQRIYPRAPPLGSMSAVATRRLRMAHGRHSLQWRVPALPSAPDGVTFSTVLIWQPLTQRKRLH